MLTKLQATVTVDTSVPNCSDALQAGLTQDLAPTTAPLQ
jgi:hypothetical protein